MKADLETILNAVTLISVIGIVIVLFLHARFNAQEKREAEEKDKHEHT